MLISAAIGDAYGAGFEFVEPERWPANNGKYMYGHPDLPIGNGQYTDDAQMLLALAEVITKNDLSAITDTMIYEAWHTAYNRDPRPGYSRGFQSLLETTENGKELQEKINPDSTRSGAVMRAAVGGFLRDHIDVIELTDLHVNTTHDTDIARECARAVALAAHFLVHRVGKRKDLGKYLNANVHGKIGIDWTEDRTSWASVEAVDCSRNAITAFRNSSNMTEVLVNSVAPGGDTDTVASIAMALAWCNEETFSELDTVLFQKFETGEYGFPYLLNASVWLTEKYLK